MDILVSTDWLAAHLDNVVILDASAHLPSAERNPSAEFADGHIAGARFLDLPSLKDLASPVPAALPTAAQFSRRLCELGIATDDRVVLYDNSNLRSSARAFLMFKLFGFGEVALLDGGFPKWTAEKRPVEAGTPTFPSTEACAIKEDWTRIRSKQDMLANCQSRAEQVVDARDADRFTGRIHDAVHGLEGGHIPGARNLPFTRLLADDGTFKNVPELEAEFSNAGIDLDRPLAASCGSGVTASVVLFAMLLLGREGALYDGSWSEWGADPETPKETGEAQR